MYVCMPACIHVGMKEYVRHTCIYVHMYPCLTKRYLDMIRIHQSMHDVLQLNKTNHHHLNLSVPPQCQTPKK